MGQHVMSDTHRQKIYFVYYGFTLASKIVGKAFSSFKISTVLSDICFYTGCNEVLSDFLFMSNNPIRYFTTLYCKNVWFL